MSFLTEEEQESLFVRHAILHVVQHVAGQPEAFQAQSELPSEGRQDDFFLARIKESAPDAVHALSPTSSIKATLERTARGELGFEESGQNLARAFARTHIRQTSPGAFIVFDLGTSMAGTTVYGLFKYDYRSVLELVDVDGPQALRRITQAFVTDKRAIQKSCLVRVVDGVAEGMVCALDRNRPAPDLTDYFMSFLEVSRERSDDDLSRDLDDVVRKTLQELKDVLPNRDVPAALDIAKQSLRGRTTIDDAAVRDAVTLACGEPMDPGVQGDMEKSLTRHLKRKRLVGVEFKPSPSVLKLKPRRRMRTAENVVVQYPGEQENQTVSRERSGSGWVITVRTSKELVDDDVLPPDRS